LAAEVAPNLELDPGGRHRRPPADGEPAGSRTPAGWTSCRTASLRRMAKRHKLSKSSLHWFIKSRPYVLIPELRRRFEMELEEEEAVPIQLQQGRAFVALPARAARLLEDLVKEQRVGLEMAVD